MRLRLAIKSVIIRGDTIPLSLYAEHNTHQPDNYLGKTITIKGQLILTKKCHQSNIIVGSIIDKNYRHSFAGRLFNNVSGYINELFKNSFNPDYTCIAQGLVLGGSSRLNQELKKVFVRAGVLHILAVSGLHIGFIIAFLGIIFLFLPVSPKLKLFLIMLFLICYAGITGFRPSVLRASLMAFLFGFSFILQRQVDAIHIVNMSALILLFVNPMMLFDTGTQLSFGAVYGIVYLLPKINTFFLKNIKVRILKPILWSMATSFSAQVFVSPFLIQYFNQLPTLAVFSNLLIVPLASIIIYLLFILIIVSFIFAPAVNIISFFINQIIWLLEKIAGFFAALPFSSINIYISPIFLILFFFIFVNKTRKLAIFTTCLIAIFFSLSSLAPISFIKITNHTALITLPNREKILICNQDTRILPDNFYNTEINYLIAPKRITQVKNEYVPMPESFYYKSLKISDFRFQLDKEINIQWRDYTLRLPEDLENNLIRYIICGRKGIYQFEAPGDISVLDRIISDFRIHFGYLRATF